MSFILDALKKLEQNRKRGEVPDLTTVHLQVPERSKKKPAWPYLLLAALLLNAGIITALLRPWEEKEVIAQPDMSSTEEIAMAETALDKVADTKAMTDGNIIANKKPPVSAPAAEKKITDNIPETVAAQEDLIEQEVPAVKSDEEVIASIGLDPTPEELHILRNKIKDEQNFTEQMPIEEIREPAEPEIIEPEDRSGFIEFSQLPEETRKELPVITVNGHIYSDNRSARIANINGYITREGEKVTSELILDEITPAGVIFSYREYRFRMRVF